MGEADRASLRRGAYISNRRGGAAALRRGSREYTPALARAAAKLFTTLPTRKDAAQLSPAACLSSVATLRQERAAAALHRSANRSRHARSRRPGVGGAAAVCCARRVRLGAEPRSRGPSGPANTIQCAGGSLLRPPAAPQARRPHVAPRRRRRSRPCRCRTCTHCCASACPPQTASCC